MVNGPERFAQIAFAFLFFLPLGSMSASAQLTKTASTTEARDAEYAALRQAVSGLQRQSNVLKRVVKLVRPAVAHIEVHKGGGEPSPDNPADETGSGVVFRKDGKYYVLTNRHLIVNTSLSNVTLTLGDARVLRPKQKWMDARTDIAVLAIEGKNLVAARFGDSDQLEIGDYVLAIGSPFGLNHSVTFGIVSAKGRRDLELSVDGVNPREFIQDFLQIDAAINPGSSGGPLVSLQGEVIGINTAIASTSGHNEGIGFTIPITMASNIAYQLVEHGEVRRGFLGVRLDSHFTDSDAKRIGLDRPRGARISLITDGTPAHQANLKPGDVVLQFDGTWIDDDSHLVNRVSLTAINVKVPMLIYRDGKQITEHITLVRRPPRAN
jgi:serine protease Do